MVQYDMLHWQDYLKILTALLVIVNPLGALPLFVTLTANQTSSERRRTACTAAISVAAVLVASCLFGEALLGFFGVSIAAFRVAGGLLILLLAISMFHAQTSGSRHTPEELDEASEKAGVGVVPLAIPLLSGPGAISTTIIYANQSSSTAHLAMLSALGLVVALVVWIALLLASPIGALLGRTGINIFTRLMGLLLAAISIEIIAGGIGKLLPGLQ